MYPRHWTKLLPDIVLEGLIVTHFFMCDSKVGAKDFVVSLRKIMLPRHREY